jgi:hypothetical protein
MEKLLDSRGKEIYGKFLGIREKADFQGKIWGARNFRVDAGHTVNGSGGKLKTWNLQVNGHHELPIAKELKNSRGTHEKLFWDAFNISDSPTFEAWVEAILNRFH